MLADLLSVWFVLWGNAVLAGRVSLDEGADGIAGPDATHRVQGLPEDPVAMPMTVALGRLRTSGVTRLSLALPVPGDPLGLGGPPTFTTEALAAGEAVLVPERGLGLVPDVSDGRLVQWHAVEQVVAAEPGEPLGPAETALRLALVVAADQLTDLDVVAGNERPRRGSAPRRRLPPGTDGRAAHLLETADRMLETVAAALADDGGALTTGQASRRRAALQPLEHAARRAVVTACAQPQSEQPPQPRASSSPP